MMQVVLVGYYGFGNGGDEALLQTLLQMLPEHVQPIVLSANPEGTSAAYGVKSINRWNLLEVLGAMGRAEGFIWGGGSLMQDSSSWRNPLYYGGLMVIAQAMGLKTIAWAQGLGPLQRQWTRALTRMCLQRCTDVSVRDQASSEMLGEWKIPHTVVPDPVWALEATPYESSWSANTVAVVLRPHALLTEERFQIILQALQAFQQETSAYLLFLPFQGTDVPLAEMLQTQLLSSNSQILRIEDPRRLKGVFQGVKMAIAMRLHGVIMAVSEGVPTSAISYDPKVTQLMKAHQIHGFLLDDFPSDPNILIQAWMSFFQQNEGLKIQEEWRLKSLKDNQTILLNTLIS